jgi:ribosome-binding factor A
MMVKSEVTDKSSSYCYDRVQGPTFLFEHDNTQNNANHIHTVWRDLENDFGDDLLKRHYEQSPHPK